MTQVKDVIDRNPGHLAVRPPATGMIRTIGAVAVAAGALFTVTEKLNRPAIDAIPAALGARPGEPPLVHEFIAGGNVYAALPNGPTVLTGKATTLKAE